MVQDNYEGNSLGHFTQQICDQAPTEEELLDVFTALGIDWPKLLTVAEAEEEFEAVMRPFYNRMCDTNYRRRQAVSKRRLSGSLVTPIDVRRTT